MIGTLGCLILMGLFSIYFASILTVKTKQPELITVGKDIDLDIKVLIASNLPEL